MRQISVLMDVENWTLFLDERQVGFPWAASITDDRPTIHGLLDGGDTCNQCPTR
jgi:hypothetical protein